MGWRRGRGKIGREEEEGIWKIAFWNVAGIGNKDRNFWQRIKEWDIISMMETLLDKKKWEEARGRLPKEYRCKKRGEETRKVSIRGNADGN